MKKIILYVCTFILVFIPFIVKAARISDTSITGTTEKKIGEELSLSFKINFSELENQPETTLGIWLISFELIFDDEVLYPISIYSNNFESNIYLDETTGKYYVLSEVIENDLSKKHCVNGVLYCDNYSATINFFVKDTELTSSTVKMGTVEVGLLDMIDDNRTYTYDDLIEISSVSNKSHTVIIKQTEKEVEEPKKDIVTTNSTTQKKEVKTQTETNQTITKSSNTFLSSLNIENYKIEFDKNTKNYTIYVDEEVNSLNISAEVEDGKANYNIIGANDLKANDYKVIVEVTAEDNTKNTYTINIKLNKEEVEKEIEEKTPTSTNKESKKLDKKIIIYIGIGVGIIILILVIVLIINKKKTKEIDKFLDQL